MEKQAGIFVLVTEGIRGYVVELMVVGGSGEM